MQNKVLLELLKKLRIPSSFGSSIVADKSSVDLVSPGFPAASVNEWADP